MSRIQDSNYFVVSGWMMNQLGLKGTDLLVYAIIYGFSQDGETEFTGSIQYLCDFCGGVSRPTIISSLKRLAENGLIVKTVREINGVTFNRYRVVKNFNGGSNNFIGGVKNLYRGGKKILPNNKEYKEVDKEDNIYGQSLVERFESLWKMYPRKQGKNNAYKAYEKAVKAGTKDSDIKQGIEQYCAFIKREHIELKYIKHGSTWFNGQCWRDDYGGQAGSSDLDDIF